MPIFNLPKTACFVRDALCGLGILYISQLAGWVNLTVQGIDISPDQAHAIQNNLEYSTEVLRPAKKGAK